MSIQKTIQNCHDRLVVKHSCDERLYKILRDYQGTYIEEVMKSEERMVYPIFRVFESAKPSRNRKLNIDPTHCFDPYNDSLMDYASIIGNKLQKPWQLFNRLVSLQIPLCPNDCWHCYLPKELYATSGASRDRYEECSAETIINRFLEQRKADKRRSLHSNVLRITGGEPFLVPELIIECLKIIKERKLDDELFLWTETNIEPFVGEEGKAFMDAEENIAILKELGQFSNLVVHPCFHGLSPGEFNIITGRSYEINLEQQIKGLERLLEAGIDVYPTFGSNVCDPSKIEGLFGMLKNLSSELPLRVALVEYNCDYEPVKVRLKESGRMTRLYSHFASLRIWNELLLKHYGIGYGILPRHLANIGSGSVRLNATDITDSDAIPYGNEIIYFFKSSYRDLYHREILDLLAYPFDFIYEVEYDKKWVQDDLFFHMTHVPELYVGRKGLWFYVDRYTSTVLPLRECEIIGIEGAREVLTIKLKFKRYVSFPNFQDKALSHHITQVLGRYFGSKTLPPGGKYMLLGESLLEDLSESGDDSRGLAFFHAFRNGDEKGYVSSSLDAFRDIIPEVAKSKDMKRSLFYRVVTEGLQREKEEKKRTLYRIEGGKTFKVALEFFLPNYKEFSEKEAGERTITVRSSSPAIVSVGPTTIVCSKYGKEELRFRTKKVKSSEEVVVTIQSEYDQFRAGKVHLHILVEAPHVKNALCSAGAALILILMTGGFANLSQARGTGTHLWQSTSAFLDHLFFDACGSQVVLNAFYILIMVALVFLLFYLNSKGYISKPK